MQRRHFEFIADVIRNMPTNHSRDVRNRLVMAETFADALKATNPQFSRQRFIEACLTSVPNVRLDENIGSNFSGGFSTVGELDK